MKNCDDDALLKLDFSSLSFFCFLLPNPVLICYRIYIYFTRLINDTDSFGGWVFLDLFSSVSRFTLAASLAEIHIGGLNF